MKKFTKYTIVGVAIYLLTTFFLWYLNDWNPFLLAAFLTALNFFLKWFWYKLWGVITEDENKDKN